MNELYVKFPKPCDEDWDAMAPSGCHRHCASCDQVIHDLERMTGEEAQALLNSGEEACVRAKLGPDGAVKLAASGLQGSPRLRTSAVSAIAGLALSACTTTPLGTVTPRYELSGSLEMYWGEFEVRLEGEGKNAVRRVDGNGDYRFTNLKAGLYRIHLSGPCIASQTVDVTISDEDVQVQTLAPTDGIEGCIIVGKMEPADPPERV